MKGLNKTVSRRENDIYLGMIGIAIWDGERFKQCWTYALGWAWGTVVKTAQDTSIELPGFQSTPCSPL